MTNLITLEEYKVDQGITKADEDERLSQLISQVSTIIQDYLKKKFIVDDGSGPVVVTETISLDYDSDTVFLDNYPIGEILEFTVVEQGYPYDSTVRLPVAASEYIVDYEDGKLLRTTGYWRKGRAAIQITYTLKPLASVDMIPMALKRVAIDLVKYYRKEEYKESKSLNGASINNNNGAVAKDFPPHIQKVLDLYR